MTLENELKLWLSVQTALESVPKDCRSQNHSKYLAEVEDRVRETKELRNHMFNPENQ